MVWFASLIMINLACVRARTHFEGRCTCSPHHQTHIPQPQYQIVILYCSRVCVRVRACAGRCTPSTRSCAQRVPSSTSASAVRPPP
eukprot:2724881-Rhodomonas_salina.10